MPTPSCLPRLTLSPLSSLPPTSPIMPHHHVRAPSSNPLESRVAGPKEVYAQTVRAYVIHFTKEQTAASLLVVMTAATPRTTALSNPREPALPHVSTALASTAYADASIPCVPLAPVLVTSPAPDTELVRMDSANATAASREKIAKYRTAHLLSPCFKALSLNTTHSTVSCFTHRRLRMHHLLGLWALTLAFEGTQTLHRFMRFILASFALSSATPTTSRVHSAWALALCSSTERSSPPLLLYPLAKPTASECNALHQRLCKRSII